MTYRPQRLCLCCRKRCTAESGVCQGCQEHYDIPLRGGRWVPRGLVQVWVKDGADVA